MQASGAGEPGTLPEEEKLTFMGPRGHFPVAPCGTLVERDTLGSYPSKKAPLRTLDTVEGRWGGTLGDGRHLRDTVGKSFRELSLGIQTISR
jgi:hypothetical protein